MLNLISLRNKFMNQLIVVPRIVNTVGDWYQFPLGIAYISSSWRKTGFNLFTANLNNLEGDAYSILKGLIEDHDIRIVLTGGLTGQYGAIKAILSNAKKINKDMITVVGGGIITSAPEHAMQALEFADYGIIGEGEIITSELCTALENGADIRTVAGVVYKSATGYVRTSIQVAPVHLDQLPFPDYKSFGLEQLLKSVPNVIGMCEYNTLPIITSRS